MRLLIYFGLLYTVAESRYSFQCPYDNDACTDITCPTNDASRRAGFICDTFPYYSGGFPEWDTEIEFYLCADWAMDEDAFCTYWMTMEKSDDEYEIGSCACNNYGPRYCLAWSCVQVETSTDDDGEDNGYEEEYYACGSNVLGETVYCSSSSEVEITNCWCRGEDEATGGHYCSNWYCEEYDMGRDDWQSSAEEEDYTCISTEPPTFTRNADQWNGDYDMSRYDDQFCWIWEGDILSNEEFEVSKCWCLAPDLYSGQYCQSWKCKEVGMARRRNHLWYNFWLCNVLLGLMCCCGAGFVAVQMSESDSDDNEVMLLGVACCWCIMSFAFVAWGGFMSYLFMYMYFCLGLCCGYAFANFTD